jgi:hypothetical protein
MVQLNWGDIPSGVGAILTGISLVIAALAYRRSVRNGEMAQAELIASWIDNELDNAIIVVRNSSKLPVYMTEAYIRIPLEADKRFFIGTLLPESTQKINTNIKMQSAMPVDRLNFIDMAGKRWTRSELGVLRQMKHNWSSMLRPVRRLITHPSGTLKWILPSCYFGRSSVPIDSQWQAMVVQAAVWEGHRDRIARSAVAKYKNNQRLTLAEKRALMPAIRMLPGLFFGSEKFNSHLTEQHEPLDTSED